MSNYMKMEPEDWDEDRNPAAQPKRIAIAKLIAACYLDQEAALLTASPIAFDNPEDVLVAKRVIEKVKARLRATAEKLRRQ